LTEFVFLPGLFKIAGSLETFSVMDFFYNKNLWMFFVFLMFITGIVSGFYPALYVARQKPVTILKGSSTISGKKTFAGFLLSFQFGITFLIITLVVTFLQNNKYQIEKNWGYDQTNIMNIRLDNESQFNQFRNTVQQIPGVVKTSGTVNQIGANEYQAVIEINTVKHEVVHFKVDNGYLELLGMQSISGRFFDDEHKADANESIVVNEMFLATANIQNYENQTVVFENKSFNIIGTVKDFHHAAFFYEIRPVMMTLVPNEQSRYLVVKIQDGTKSETASKIEKEWRKLYPNDVFNANFQDNVFENHFRSNETVTGIFAATAIVTLIISAMGLFGLVTLMISKRAKELSIHKIQGASTFQISKLITRRFAILITVSSLIAIPLGRIVLIELLNNMYPYHMELGILPFVIASLVIFATATLTIGYRVYKSAVENPIKSLRYE